MLRKRMKKAPVLKDFNEVDETLKTIAQQELLLEKAELAMMTKINNAKDKYKTATEGVEDKIVDLELRLESFCTYHRDEFKDKKSKEMPFGIVGFENSKPSLKAVKGMKWDKVIALLRSNRKRNFLKYPQPSVDKEVVKSAFKAERITEDELETLGMRIVQKEEFYYKTKRDNVSLPQMDLLDKEKS